MTRWILALACVLGLPASAPAGSHVTVLPDKILTGVTPTEFVPRFVTYVAKTLVVPAGQAVTLPADSTWDAIEVAGTLRCARTNATVLRFTHLTVLPGGYFDCGTEAAPVSAVLIVRNVPLDTGRDPYQFGNGLINFGRRSLVGVWRTPKVVLAGDVPAAARRLDLPVPANWRVGDELFLPDLHQITAKSPIRREPRVTIASLGAGFVTLSQPLAFAHLTAADAFGVVLRPRVFNLTRTAVLASESATGTRGHTIDIGHEATWDVRAAVFVDLGRTRNVTLDSTNDDASHVGENQVGRYGCLHAHHAQGVGSVFSGNVCRGGGGGKWGVAIHGTHDTIVEDTLAFDFPGAAFVTEDGYEVRNVFRRNAAFFSTGNGGAPLTNIRPPRNCPGCEGAAFWLRGPQNIIEENEAYNSHTGMSLFYGAQVLTASIPSVPGGMPDTPFNPRTAVPISLARNIVAANDFSGYESWNAPRFPNVDLIATGNRNHQVFAQLVEAYLVRPILVATGGVSSGVFSSGAYTPSVEVEGGRITGCGIGLQMAARLVRVVGTDIQCKRGVAFSTQLPAKGAEFTSVKMWPFGAEPKKYLVLRSAPLWTPGTPLPKASVSWTPAIGARVVLRDWNRTGRDYRVYEPQSLASAPAWVSNAEFVGCPVEGWTMEQCWQTYGLAYAGGVIQDAAAQTLEGINAIVAEGAAVTLGPPRLVLAWPTASAPYAHADARVTGAFVLTGSPIGTLRAGAYRVDGGPILTLSNFSLFDRTSPLLPNAPGTHTVTTWRKALDGSLLVSSELVFTYIVSETE